MSVEITEELFAYRQQLTGFLGKLAQQHCIAGVALELLVNGQRVAAAVGPLGARDDTPISGDAQFGAGGLTRWLLAVIVLQLAASNRLDVDAPIANYLAELGASPIGQQVSARHLLCHTGGYRSTGFANAAVREHYTWNQLVDFLNATTLMFAPGTVFSYSLSGSAILSQIVRRVTGVSAAQIVRETIIEKLSLSAAGRGRAADDPPAPRLELLGFDSSAGKWHRLPPLKLSELWRTSLLDTPLSLADIAAMLDEIIQCRNAISAQPFVTREVATLLQSQLVQIPFTSGGPRSDRLPISGGMGSPAFCAHWVGWSNDSTIPCAFRYHTSRRIVMAVAMNAHRPYVQQLIFDELSRSLGSHESAPPAEAAAVEFEAGELAGTYVGSSGGNASVAQQGKQLVCEFDGGGNGKLRVLMLQNPQRKWTVGSDAGSWSLGFFRDPTSGVPCLMVGPTAYRSLISAERIRPH